MKRILFLLLSISCMAAHAQLLSTDARYFNTNQYKAINNGIALAVKPLATVNKALTDALVKIKADTSAMAKRLADQALASAEMKNQIIALRQSNVSKDSLIKALGDTLNTTRYFTRQLNDKIYMVAFDDSARAAKLTKMIDDRSALLSSSDFITITGTTSLNMQAIIDRLKAALKLPL